LRAVKEVELIYPLPPPAYVERISLGYTDAVTSILWASTLYQYGDQVGHNRRFPFATQYVSTILHLEPNFRPAYRFVKTFVTMQTVNPERDELERVRAIYEKGTRELP